MANRAGPNDWLSAAPVDDNGHQAYELNVNVVGGTGAPSDVTIVAPLGTKAAAASTSVTLSTENLARLPASLGRKTAAASFAVAEAGTPYETVAASQTDQVLGTTGAAGDYLSHIVIQPAAAGAGTILVKDGASTIFTFTTGTLADLSPRTVPFGIFSTGALSVTTGADVAVLAVGNFT